MNQWVKRREGLLTFVFPSSPLLLFVTRGWCRACLSCSSRRFSGRRERAEWTLPDSLRFSCNICSPKTRKKMHEIRGERMLKLDKQKREGYWEREKVIVLRVRSALPSLHVTWRRLTWERKGLKESRLCPRTTPVVSQLKWQSKRKGEAETLIFLSLSLSLYHASSILQSLILTLFFLLQF